MRNHETERQFARCIPVPAGLPAQRGMTLVEMLVALTSTLLMMGVIAQIFAMLGSGVNGSRNIVELSDRMRSAQYTLRHDLAGATAAGMQPPLDPEANLGYFEIIEGPETDSEAFVNGQRIRRSCYFMESGVAYGDRQVLDAWIQAVGSDDRLVGDTDDILLFTTRSTTSDFVGLAVAGGQSIRSPCAEVLWFCRPMPNTANPRMYALHRRQRLVMAHPGAAPFVRQNDDLDADRIVPAADGGAANTAATTDKNLMSDVSCRIEGGRLAPNTLGDLTKRENRFLHGPVFPHVFQWNSPTLELTGERLGEDVMLTNVIAFDVRVFDLGAPIKLVGDIDIDGTRKNLVAVAPGEPGYSDTNAIDAGFGGAFVDLHWNWAAHPLPAPFNAVLPGNGIFAGLGHTVRNGSPQHLLVAATYDTWSTHYEYNGRDDDQDQKIDQGTNGVDDNGNGLIDEPAEAETRPPYATALRGVEVRIRCFDPVSRQIRQIIVRQTF